MPEWMRCADVVLIGLLMSALGLTLLVKFLRRYTAANSSTVPGASA